MELSQHELLLWRRYNAVLTTVPGMIDERMRAATGLSRFQFTLLDTIESQPDGRLHMSAVAKATDSSLSRLSHSIARLEEAGLVERAPCEEDRRASWAVITPAGRRAVVDARERLESVMREVLLDRVPEGRQDDAIAFLTSLLPADVAETCATVDGVSA